MNAVLLQLTQQIRITMTNGLLGMSFGSDIYLNGTSILSTDEWHHFGFTYDAEQRQMTIYIDGEMDSTKVTSQPSASIYNQTDSPVLIGVGYRGYIDQLSISLKMKSAQIIQWDATTAAYYPMDLQWLEDKGPYGITATASSVTSVIGWLKAALNFNQSDAYFTADDITRLGRARKPFTISLWVRSETQAGVILTVANPHTCLLVLGLQNESNLLVAYFPNSTIDGKSAIVVGPQMPENHWVHVTLTWSMEYRARLYTSGYLQNSNVDVTTLNNARGVNNSMPMTVTLGNYRGEANCGRIDGVNTFCTIHGFIG